ncbi:MAG: hypothetical protein AMXMBFR13_40790 [Phycisphaerae bacterium]
MLRVLMCLVLVVLLAGLSCENLDFSLTDPTEAATLLSGASGADVPRGEDCTIVGRSLVCE